MARLLIVRLSSLGDLVHTLPLVAALRRAFPEARLDWLVDERYAAFLDLVPVVDGRIVFRGTRTGGWRELGRLMASLRRARYDAALDVQGLLKSAVLARASGAARVVGFAARHLREPSARVFYSETVDPGGARHVIEKNLALLSAFGVNGVPWQFPLAPIASSAPAEARRALGIGRSDPFVLLNPGAGWPNKRWPPERFGAVAVHLRRRHGLPALVIWGPGEQALARAVVDAAAGAATPAPATTLGDLVALARESALFVGGDTGPLHLAAAVGTPIVAIYGPTDPARNGPWHPWDLAVGRFHRCRCRHQRRCRAASWCLGEVSVDEVAALVDERLRRGREPS